jgi:hypothetical protein
VDRRVLSDRVRNRPVRVGHLRRQAGHAPGSSGGNAGFGRGGAGHGGVDAGDAKGKAYEEEG